MYLRYATISSIKKMRDIIHFEKIMDWCAILYVLSICITDIIQRTLFMSQNCVLITSVPICFILLLKL